MRTIACFVYCAVILLASPLAVVRADTLDCGSKTLSTGDSRVDLLVNCGEPESKESHEEELITTATGGLRQKTFITVENWTYNFGPSQFVRIVTLKNGRIAEIRTGDYGTSKSTKPEKPEFSGRIVSIGDSMGDVTAKWGDPAFKETRQEEFREPLGAGQLRKTFVTIEEWTYNLGPNRFMRILTFRNGKVSDIRTGSYGYREKE